jgi:hypothetical protein
MRRWSIAAAVAILALTLAGVAIATDQFKQVSNITLTGHSAGKTTGIASNVYSVDPAAPGHKPKAAKQLTITFPSGTKFNLGAVKRCTLSDKQLTDVKVTKCPSATQIGSGSATANAAPLPGLSALKLSVGAYVRDSRTMLLQVITKGVPPVLIKSTVSGTKLKIPIPQQKVNGIAVVLTALKLNVGAHGSGSHALITAGKCTGGKFVVKSHFSYVDGSTYDTSSSSNCS